MNKTASVVVTIVVIAAVIGVLGYLYNKQNSNPEGYGGSLNNTPGQNGSSTNPDDWKVWTNNTFKFTVKLPQDWRIHQQDMGGFSMVLIFDATSNTDKARITLPDLKFSYKADDPQATILKSIQASFDTTPDAAELQRAQIIP